MWERRSLHQCADELEVVSSEFRALWQRHFRYFQHDQSQFFRDYPAFRRLSVQGVELLKILAVTIRSEQDYGLIPGAKTTVGAWVKDFSNDISAWHRVIQTYAPPYCDLPDSEPLPIREALNKVVHGNPARSYFYADAENHDLILTGTLRSRGWLVAISLPAIADDIRRLPDRATA
jgi:hypothetical protein